jgi:serine/threonine protein kinase
MVFAPGAAIGQNLRLVRLMAKGGMGSIWVADHLGLKSQVAVKFIDESLDTDPSLLARFEREAAAAAKIRSPHVVQILDHGSINGRVPYIVMELLEGESLGSRIARLGRLGLEETAVVISQTCKGLSRVHALSFVHRDIKPDNLFLIDSGGELFVKVLDFGVAKQKAEKALTLTSTGTAVGTPHYMSPEQLLSSKDATTPTDLWAMGVVAYRALTGALPFDGETYGALCAAVSQGTFRQATELRADLPAAMDAWFERALAAEPGNRFASARDLADAFVAAAGLATSRLSVPLSLPPETFDGTLAAPPAADGSGETLAAPSPGSSTFPSTGSGGRNLGGGGRLPSGASIAGASIPNGERPRRQNLALFVAGAAAVGGLALGLVLARGGAPTASQAPAHASAPGAPAGVPLSSAVAVSPATLLTAPSATASVAPPDPIREQPASASQPPSREAAGRETGSPFHVRATPATVRAGGPGHVSGSPPAGGATASPPSAPPIDTDHGF